MSSLFSTSLIQRRLTVLSFSWGTILLVLRFFWHKYISTLCLEMLSRGASLLIWVFFVHLAGIYLFTSGFLLTRLSLSEFNDCSSCTSSPTYKRTVFLVIDALRFDFISPNPPYPSSPYHHNILKLPAELTSTHPERSFIFNAYADRPQLRCSVSRD